MKNYWAQLRPYQSCIAAIALIISFVGYAFQDGFITAIAGVFVTAPLQISILRNERIGSGPLFRRIFYAESLHYALLSIAVWSLPLILGLSVLSHFFWGYLDNYRLMYFPAFILFAFLLAYAAPELLNIATGRRGRRLLFWDMMKIYLIWTGYMMLRGAGGSLQEISKVFYLLTTPFLFYAFILAFSLQAVVIRLRNEEG